MFKVHVFIVLQIFIAYRAAAMRCRQKRKTWIADLEKRAEHMLTANQQLQLENTTLKAEVAQLKTLLLAHKDCPVTQAITQAMTEGTVIIKIPSLRI